MLASGFDSDGKDAPLFTDVDVMDVAIVVAEVVMVGALNIGLGGRTFGFGDCTDTGLDEVLGEVDFEG